MKIIALLILWLCLSCKTQQINSSHRLTIRDSAYTGVFVDSLGHADSTHFVIREYYVKERKSYAYELAAIVAALIYIIFKISK